MSYTSRVYRQRNAHTHDETKDQSPFFTKSEKQSGGRQKGTPFFQTKLSVGEPGDQYEKEADSVAASVVNKKTPGPVMQQKKISSIQRLATSQEEEKTSTNDERMKQDRDIQEKPEVQTKCAECEEEEKGKGVQKKTDPEKEKEKKKGAMINKKTDPEKEKEKDKMKAPANLQKKGDHSSGAGRGLSSRIEHSSGKGRPMPRKTLEQMQSSFGHDFHDVNIHIGSEAAEMNKELGAQAFTHDNDIYFNSGKYQPENCSGKQLLAHELTHVVQQNGGDKKV